MSRVWWSVAPSGPCGRLSWVMAQPFQVSIDVAHPGTTQEEWYDLRGDGSTQYYLKHWYPTDPSTKEVAQPKAAVVFVHGFADYCDRYTGVFRVLPDRGIQVSGFDQLGFGRTWHESPNRATTHGWTSWPDQFRDVSCMLRLTRARLDERWGKDTVPLYLMGHSMGGGITAAFFTRDPASPPEEEVKQLVSGAILMSPWLDIHFPIPTSVGIPVMRSVLRWFPTIKLPLGPPSKDLCRESAVVQDARVNPLSSCYVHVRGLYGPLSGGPQIVAEDYRRWPERLPLLICHGTGDKVTRWDCSKKLYDHLKGLGRSVQLVSFTGFYHEAIFEPGQDKVLFAQTLVDWVEKQVEARGRPLPPANERSVP